MYRSAPLAGRWYPGDAAECRASLERHLGDPPAELVLCRGLMGPHAGWTYSGDCAGRTYRRLARARPDATLVVLFASHRGPSGPHTIFLGSGWETPLGRIPTHDLLAACVCRDESLALQEEPVRPLRPDNAVELHLPFIRYVFPRAKLLMLGIGASEAALTIGKRLGELAHESGEDAVFIGSTDLTHYGPDYGFIPAGRGPEAVRWVRETNDRAFLDRILSADPRGALAHAVERKSACCPGAAAATMEAVRAYEGELRPTLVDHYLSYDIRPSESFVGYAGVIL